MKERKEGARRIFGSIPLATRMDLRKAAGLVVYFRKKGGISYRMSGMISELLETAVDELVTAGETILPDTYEEAATILQSAGLLNKGIDRVLTEEATERIIGSGKKDPTAWMSPSDREIYSKLGQSMQKKGEATNGGSTV